MFATLAAGDSLLGQDLGIKVNEPTRYWSVSPSLYTVPRTAATLNAGILDNLYQGILGRPGREPGRSAYLARLNAGTPVNDIVREFLQSREYRSRQVRQYYGTFLGRNATAAEIAAGVSLLEGGRPEADVIAGIMTSAEFTNAGRVDTASFMQSVYKLLLGRNQPSGEGAGWQFRLDTGATTRRDVVRAFLASPEANRRIVNAAYASWLKRPADAAGLTLWSDRLARGTTFGSFAGAIFSSAEVRRRTLAGQG